VFRPRNLFGLLLVAASLLALFTARPYAGGWNDGGRLATVESLGDRGTLHIDDSIYVQPHLAARPPYTPDNEFFARFGTKDKMFIGGHYYSDKSPVPAVMMAGTYRVLRWCGLPPARERPDWFARVMTWFFAGLPYVLAVFCIGRIARHIGVPAPWDLILMAAFAFGSLALPYAQHVNNHILLLAVAAGICEAMWRSGPMTTWRAVWLGTLAGFAYSIDLGAGPPLTAAVGVWFLWQRTRVWAFTLGAIPWIVAHHVLNYAIAGTLAPSGANPEFFKWPGSEFDEKNMTGSWQHASLLDGGVYALEMLVGEKGFLLFSLPLLQAIGGLYWLVCRRYAERPVVFVLLFWGVATWLLYAATSTNFAGYCISVRWFVPLLAPGFVALMILARDYAVSRRPLLILIGGSLVLNLELVARGPWSARVPLFLWPVVSATLLVWLIAWVLCFRTATGCPANGQLTARS
jgi:hypothetical protein